MVLEQIGPLPVCRVVDPVALRPRWVVRVEHNERLAASNDRLLYRADLLRVLELIQLLEPQVLDIALRHLDGLGFLDLVRTAKENHLSGRDEGQPQRADSGLPLAFYAQLGNTPEQLLEHAVVQLFLVAAECNGVGHDTVLCIAHDAEDDLRADGRRLDRTAPAVQLVVGVPACGDVAVHLVERRRDDVGQLNLFCCRECRQ